MADLSAQDVESNARLLLEEARWRRDDQVARQAGLNQRLATLFALNFAVLALLGASLRFGDFPLPTFVEIVIYVTIANLLLNIAILLWGLKAGSFVRSPNLDAMTALVRQGTNVSELTFWTVARIMRVVERNEPGLTSKAKWAGRATVASLLAVVLVALAIALTSHYGAAA